MYSKVLSKFFNLIYLLPKMIGKNSEIVFKFKIINGQRKFCFLRECIDINEVKVSIYSPDGLLIVDVEDTPHYKSMYEYVNNNNFNFSHYKAYKSEWFPKLDINEQVSKFLATREFLLKEKDIVISANYSNGITHIIDGLHRASIAKVELVREIYCDYYI